MIVTIGVTMLVTLAVAFVQVDAGDLTPRMSVPPSASREVRVLAYAFNHMLDRLRDAFDA